MSQLASSYLNVKYDIIKRPFIVDVPVYTCIYKVKIIFLHKLLIYIV